MPNWKFHGNLTYEEFMLDWFGYMGGRELGDPLQKFTDNPKNILSFVETCRLSNKPAYMSVAYRKKHDIVSALDRIFFDFDCKSGKDGEKLELELNAMKFIRMLLRDFKIVPMVVKTFHGYHVWIFLKTTLTGYMEDLKKVYVAAHRRLLRGQEFYYDTQIFGDVKRIARIPLSWHEKGAWCMIVELDEKTDEFIPSKIRDVNYFKVNGLNVEDIIEDAKTIINADVERKIYLNGDIPKFDGKFQIRPCFSNCLNLGVMGHQQRLALVIEAFWSGKKFDEIVDLFRNLRDFNENITKYQVEWQIKKIKGSWAKPYRCKTIKALNWCIGNKCKFFKP